MPVHFYYILVGIIAYLLGSLNFSLIVSHFVFRKDIREYGSKSAGATNSLRMMGKKWAAVISLGDFAKGAGAVLIGQAIMYGLDRGGFGVGEDPMLWGQAIAGLFVIVGHMYPVFFGFRGGKSVWTTGGVIAIFDWRVVIVCLVVFVIIVILTRYVSLGSMLAGIAAPIAMWLFNRGCDEADYFIVVTAILCLLVVVKHYQNIGRLLKGTENKLSLRRKKTPEREM
ncbi:MAG: glycerol-3-phosphate 1-O-acyltransferase PlsY [Oscillospiraceae bacterium]|nr:glycerol-3-phosphate 1-O-acyltransferase PlsY [Oscillospiraceae bacterium]